MVVLEVLGALAILVVDDDPGTLESFDLILRKHGHRVITAATGAEALALTEGSFLRLALIDVQLPDLSGLDVLRHLRHHDGTLPAIMITGHGFNVKTVEAMKLGAADFFVKPVFVEQLLEAVELYARSPGATDAGESNLHAIRAEEIIRTRFEDPALSAQSVANARGITREHLSRVFKQHCGRTFSDVLRATRLRHAQPLLTTTDLSVEEIATRVGYVAISAFRADFKHAYGMSPRHFRAQEKRESEKTADLTPKSRALGRGVL